MASTVASSVARPSAAAPISTISAADGRCRCSCATALETVARLTGSAAAPDAGWEPPSVLTTAMPSGLPVVLTIPHTPSADTPRKWCGPWLVSSARTTEETSVAGTRTPTGMERPETSSWSASLWHETLAHERRSAKNCGVMVSRNSIAVGRPRRFSRSMCSRDSRMPRLTWYEPSAAGSCVIVASAERTMMRSARRLGARLLSESARSFRPSMSVESRGSPITTSKRSSRPDTIFVMAFRLSTTCK